MRNSFKALLILCGIFIVLGLLSLLDNERSFAHPSLSEPTPTVARPYSPAIKASGGGYTLYLPIAIGPPARIYIPIVSRGTTPTPTPTPTSTPTRIPNPIQNPGFEQPNSESGPWYASLTYSGELPIGIDVRVDRATLGSIGVTPHSGDYASWLGGFRLNGYEYAQTDLLQQITIPAGGATLRYWTWIQSEEPFCDTINIDGAWVLFGTDLWHEVESYALCTSVATTGWVKRDVNLSGYVGQTGWLAFSVRIRGLNSNLFIDDVALGTLTSASSRGETFVPVRDATPVR